MLVRISALHGEKYHHLLHHARRQHVTKLGVDESQYGLNDAGVDLVGGFEVVDCLALGLLAAWQLERLLDVNLQTNGDPLSPTKNHRGNELVHANALSGVLETFLAAHRARP